MTNPYAPPETELAPEPKNPVRSRIGWFIAPAILGAILGGLTLGGIVGTSIGDPSGESRGSAIGGFLGLIAGTIGYFMTRHNPERD